VAYELDTPCFAIFSAVPTSRQKCVVTFGLMQDTALRTDPFAPFGLLSEIGLNPYIPPTSASWVGWCGLLKCSPTATQSRMNEDGCGQETPRASVTGPSLSNMFVLHSPLIEVSSRPFTSGASAKWPTASQANLTVELLDAGAPHETPLNTS